MTDTRAVRSQGLVLVDGLPGSGKSTTAHSLCLHLDRHGYAARWFWEMEVPHPIIDFQDAIEGDALRPGFLDAALERWRAFGAEQAASHATAILESTFLQSAVQPMFALDWAPERIEAHLRDVEDAIAPAAPLLVLLHYDDVGAAFAAVSRLRAWFPEFIESKVRDTPYARRRGLRGPDGAIEYLRAYQALTERLVAGLRMPTVVLDAQPGPDAAIAALVERLALPPFAPFDTEVDDLAAFAGAYQRADSADSGDRCRIVTDGRHLYVEGEPNTRLFQRDARRFEVAGTCVEYEFHAGPGGRLERLECRGNFPNLAPTWVRHE